MPRREDIETAMNWIRAIAPLLLCLSSCGPTLHCKRLPMTTNTTVAGVSWYIVSYVGQDGVECAFLTRDGKVGPWMVFIGQHRLDKTYSLEEGERLVESKYCKL